MSHSHASIQRMVLPLASSQGQPASWALRLYNRARSRPIWRELWLSLTGRACCLLSLDAIRAGLVRSSRHVGIRLVPIHQIRGSEGRQADFDADFRPLSSHNMHRWLNVATAQLKGMTLPPVDLIQVGDIYFVQDGHHRVSVARALGRQTIEAHVLVWEVGGPLPWCAVRQPFRLSGRTCSAMTHPLNPLPKSVDSKPEQVIGACTRSGVRADCLATTDLGRRAMIRSIKGTPPCQ